MKTLMILLGKMLLFFYTLLHRKKSHVGKIMLKWDNTFLKKIKLPDNVIVVTGSNGKTATAEMIEKTLKNSGFSVACNIMGENKIDGIVALLLKHSNWRGVVNQDVLLLESDEKNVCQLLECIKPKYLVITNLYRNEMTRNGHPELIYQNIEQCITADIHLILNADDPCSALYGYKKENVTYFGIEKNELCQLEYTSLLNDGKYCPNCKNEMHYEYYLFNHIGKYQCVQCGFGRKKPNYSVTDLDLKNGRIMINKKFPLKLTLSSIYRTYDLVAAFAVARIFGVEENTIVSSLTDYVLQNPIEQKFEINGHAGMLLTAKNENPISYDQSFLYVTYQNKECTVVLIMDEWYEPHDVSWLWDVDFEILEANCVKKILAGGKYANDLAVRLENNAKCLNKMVVKLAMSDMIEEMKQSAIGNIFVIASYQDRTKLGKLSFDQ